MQIAGKSVIARLALCLSTLALGTILTVEQALAADVARDIREGRQDESANINGYLELGLHATLGGLPVVGPRGDGLHATLSPTLGGHFRLRRFFIDFLAESYSRGQLGFNLYSGPTWSFDLIATAAVNGIDSTWSEELEDFRDRPSGVDGGLRVTGFAGPFIGQFEALKDVANEHDGSLLTGTIARQYLVRNWNLHWLVGARYQSAETIQHLFGVESDEATEEFPAYTSSAGVTYVTEIGATLPLSEYLVFRGTARYWSLPDSVVNSPFITAEAFSEFTASVVFVY